MAEANWYVVHTYSGYENKVKVNLEKTIENRGLEELILDVLVPMQNITEVTSAGVIKHTKKKLFPGYVLVNMIMNDETWYVVRNTRGVTGFVGPGSKPVPLTADEMRSMGLAGGIETGAPKKPKIVVDYEPGDTVVVIAGAWEDTTGVIKEVNAQKQTVTIEVELFGRATPVEINFAEVKKK